MSDNAPLLENAFDFEPREESGWIEEIEGEIPGFLSGTYYLNGPALFARGAQRYQHWLDGDGMIRALRFGDRRAHFTSRFVRSTKFRDEEEAGSLLYRAFGTSFEGDRLHRGIGLESPVNVSVYPYNGCLLAFGEQGLPWELDPGTLETRGLYNFQRRLNPISPFSAHVQFDDASGEMFNFGVSFSGRQPLIHLYRFGPDGELVYRKRVPLEYPSSIHDFTLGPRHAVVYVSPYVLAMERLRDGATPMDSLDWRPELGSRLLVVSRDTGELEASVEIGSSYCLHLINCFEEDGLLVVDVVELDQPVYDQYKVPDLFPDVRASVPVRYRIDLEGGKVVDTVELEYRLMCDFPAIDPRRATRTYRDFWVLGISTTEREGRKCFDQLVHADWRLGEPAGIYQAPPFHYLGGEPIFLPDPQNEGRGAVICQQFDARSQASEFLIFDAFDVADGPLASLKLSSPTPLGFHASWRPGKSLEQQERTL